ncbi:hypothetical protein ACFE04_007443 [Oxalis oulophora]
MTRQRGALGGEEMTKDAVMEFDDDPLDFEKKDPLLLNYPLFNQDNKKRKKKVIQLDDLLTDFYKEKGKLVDKESKRAKPPNKYDSDDDEKHTEALLIEYVNSFENQANVEEINIGEEVSEWGMQIFGPQITYPSIISPELENCKLLQSLMNTELNSLLEITTSEGASFLEGLLTNSWLLKIVFAHGCLEKSLAEWTLNLMFYSPREDLRTSACNFWCALLSYTNGVNLAPLTIDWFPSYSILKSALEIHGFLSNFSTSTETVNNSKFLQLQISEDMSNVFFCFSHLKSYNFCFQDSDSRGPPQNITAWIKFTAACCYLRRNTFSISEAEELVAVFIYLLLDRQLLGLSVLLNENLESVLEYFKDDDEWFSSCVKIGISIAHRVPGDLNSLRAVECISGVGTRSKHLRSVVAHQFLVVCFDNKATKEEEILNLLVSIKVKDKSCNLFKLYIYLVLTENWLSYDSKVSRNPVIREMWALFLRNCSCQINRANLSLYASKIRSKASYLLQGIST